MLLERTLDIEAEAGAARPLRNLEIQPSAARADAGVSRLSAAATRAQTHLHAGVVRSLVAIHLFMFAVLLPTFFIDAEAVFMIAISAVYFVMYFGTAYAMGRAGGAGLDDGTTWGAFLDAPFETWTGIVSGRQAWIQICLVPMAIALNLAGACLIIALVR